MATFTRPTRSIDAPPRVPLRGSPLSDEQFRREVSTTPWTPMLEYGWDAGVAISRFLDSLKGGKILGVRCNVCGRTVTPPRAFCELDFRPMDTWVELPDTGTINTYSVCYVTWDMKPLRRPQIPAVIEIDGTTPRGGFLHLIGGVKGSSVEAIRKQLRVGMPVRAVWRKPDQRTGAITDIRYFEPLRGRRQ